MNVRSLLLALAFFCISASRPAIAAAAHPPLHAMLIAFDPQQQREEAGSTTGAASTNGEGPTGIVPLTKGLNATIITTSQHDSAEGWSNLLTPNVAWRFSPHWSVNGGLPVYTYVNVPSTTIKRGPKGAILSTSAVNLTQHFLLGDTTAAGAFEAHPKPFDYNVAATIGLPTGDDAKGLGAGQVTWNVNNHFEHPLSDYFIPELELGIGDSPNLTNNRVRKSYIVTGTTAHFQAGLGIALPRGWNFTSDAYEELPLAAQTVTSTTTNGKKGKQLRRVTTTSTESIGEDNGFLNTLDIPLNPHTTLSGFYNRSLRNHLDTAGFSFTFTLRKTPRVEAPL